MKISILGATSQIAKDLVLSFSTLGTTDELHLFARSPEAVRHWLSDVGLKGRHKVDSFDSFSGYEFDAVINFVGVGDPAKTVALGNSIFDITLQYDELALTYVKSHPACRYLFLSSGTAYGSSFEKPVTIDTPAVIPLNRLSPSDWYGMAKLHAECRHRAYPDLAINDIRVFNYFSSTQDINARFLMSDILRAIMDGTTLQTSSENIVRDYLHPSDFHRLVCALLGSPHSNTPVDAYSRAPVDKMSLLETLSKEAGLRYELTSSAGVNATGNKPNYYSLNRSASELGYQPAMTSVEGILSGVGAILSLANSRSTADKALH